MSDGIGGFNVNDDAAWHKANSAPVPVTPPCICFDLGATGNGQRHTLCRAHDEPEQPES